MSESLRLYNARELAEMMGMSYATASRIMLNEMQTIQTGRNPDNPRYKVTMAEIERWQRAKATSHRTLSAAELKELKAAEERRKKEGFRIPRKPLLTPKPQKKDR